jgi:hypothetical protein
VLIATPSSASSFIVVASITTAAWSKAAASLLRQRIKTGVARVIISSGIVVFADQVSLQCEWHVRFVVIEFRLVLSFSFITVSMFFSLSVVGISTVALVSLALPIALAPRFLQKDFCEDTTFFQ